MVMNDNSHLLPIDIIRHFCYVTDLSNQVPQSFKIYFISIEIILYLFDFDIALIVFKGFIINFGRLYDQKTAYEVISRKIGGKIPTKRAKFLHFVY